MNPVESERGNMVLSVIREGVIAVDGEENLIYCNPSASNILEIPLPLDVGPLNRFKLPVVVRKTLKKARNGEEFETIWKQGKKPERRYYELHGLPSLSTEGCVLVIRDITRVRRLERVRQDFVTNISHELRTPIAIVCANAETLLNGALTDPDYGPRFLSAIQRNGDRMSRLIDELLELSRLEAGQYDVDLCKRPVDGLIYAVVERLRPQAEAKHQTMELDLLPSHMAWFDGPALEHVVSNFVENAIKYTPEEGSIRIVSELRNERLFLSVIDNGPGIPAKYRPRVFERFFRVDKGRSRAEGGTGLGLSIVRHFAEAMGAQVGVAEAKPQGALFWCSLPSSLPEAAEARLVEEEELL